LVEPEKGRFITQDPVEDGNLWYAYCENNPVTYTDPTGLSDAHPGMPSSVENKIYGNSTSNSSETGTSQSSIPQNDVSKYNDAFTKLNDVGDKSASVAAGLMGELPKVASAKEGESGAINSLPKALAIDAEKAAQTKILNTASKYFHALGIILGAVDAVNTAKKMTVFQEVHLGLEVTLLIQHLQLQ
jgi:hypothetical protein